MVVLVVLAACLGPGTAGLQAQTLSNKFGGFSSKSNEPINIEADTLEVIDTKKQAIFTGNVKAVQGDFSLQAKELVVTYTGGLAGAGAGAGNSQGPKGQITRIDARGKVLIRTPDKQTATSESAIFQVIDQTITISGNVVLSQCKNVLKGEKLVIDLKTGRSKFYPGKIKKGRQRIRALFMGADAQKKTGCQ